MSKCKAPPPASTDKPVKTATRRPSSRIDTRVIYCGDNLDQLRKLPDACVAREYLWHRFSTGEPNSNRNYEVFWGERSVPRPLASRPLSAFDDRHASTQAYIEYMRPRCVELARVLTTTSSLHYHCQGEVHEI